MAGTKTLPPRYDGLPVKDVVFKINQEGNALGDVLRAWAILGYVDPDRSKDQNYKPTKPKIKEFREQIDYLWQSIRKHDDTPMGRVALARCLEALRALRQDQRSWTVDTAHLNLRGAYNSAVSWGDLEDPDVKYPSLRDAAYDELGYMDRQDVSNLVSLETDDQIEDRTWTRYHAYQGFAANDLRGIRRRFRALPAPEDDSLWHGVSFHVTVTTDDGFPNMMNHAVVKACIWTYFTQVLEHPEHLRWRDYMWLNYCLDDRDSEELIAARGRRSILRHLHCNSRVHGHLGSLDGIPASEPDPAILHVIADYYGRQIVVFKYEGAKDANGVLQRWIDPAEFNRKRTYKSYAYGHMGPTSTEPQIFLVTTDFRHFDPVIWVGDHSPFTPNGTPWFQVPVEGRVRHPAPWWKDGSKASHLEAALPGTPPRYIPHFCVPGDTNAKPGTDLWVPSADAALTDETLNLFRYGRDVPGNELVYIPTEKVMAKWTGPVERWEYKIERDGNARQIRYEGMQARFDEMMDKYHKIKRLDQNSVFRWVHRQFPGAPGMEPDKPADGDGDGDGGGGN
ncbi:hypothetical protein QBC47DRAFT_400116 [Echria macrotheca]|uniref:Uncharacterized protein n=1 Tax=Echria macrotheca TaxID=438768 RepID=A0AAJ0F8B4_9PEZI|nr:hypothetical protein QBC47DRAFT_400116 [Echria macrotheca]